MPTPNLEPAYQIKIGGSTIPDQLDNNLIELTVDTALYLPAMAVMEFYDDDLEWVDAALLAIGKEVAIVVDGEEIFKGEIASLEPDFNINSRATMIVRAYDKLHRLHRGKKTRTFVKKSDSDVASTLASEVGLSAEVDATTIEHEYIIQNNQTNMEFLQARASRIGYHLFTDGSKLFFKKGDRTLESGPTLKWGLNLRSFRPRLSAVHQATKVSVRGWNITTKNSIVGTATPVDAMKWGGMTATGGAMSQQAFGGEAEMQVVSFPIATADEATALAKSLMGRIGGEVIRAEGFCVGVPGVMAGKTVTIEGVGTRFSGKYIVTEATHHVRKGKHETAFTVSLGEPQTFNHLLGQRDATRSAEGRVEGVVIGLVTNLNDPDNLGRVKVKFPWLSDSIESTWARIAAPMAGQGSKGFYFLPEINDEVLVAFEHGDPHFPYVVGVLWNAKDKPPKQNSAVIADGKVNERIIQSRSGHMLIFNDKQGEEKIIIRDKTGKNEIVIDSAKNSLTIKTEDPVNIEAKGKITLKSATSDIEMKAKNIKLEAQQSIELKATQNVQVTATQNFQAAANVNATVEGKVGATLKNTVAEVALSGPSVNINKGALEIT